MGIIVDFKWAKNLAALALVPALYLSSLLGNGAAEAQFREVVFTQSDATDPAVLLPSAGSSTSVAGAQGIVCDVSALPPFNAKGPWFFSLCSGQQEGQPVGHQIQVVRQTCFFTTTATAHSNLSSPMLRRALLRALEAVALTEGGLPRAVGLFSLQCRREESQQAG